MEEQKNVQESLRVLLAELQKVKDLNNLSNQYKQMVADLLTAMQDYLNSQKDNTASFTQQLLQAQQSLERTRTTIDQTIGELISDVRNQNEELHLHVNKELAFIATQLANTKQTTQTTLTEKAQELTQSLTEMHQQTHKDIALLTVQMEHILHALKEQNQQTEESLRKQEQTLQKTLEAYHAESEKNYKKLKSGQTQTRLILFFIFLLVLLNLFF